MSLCKFVAAVALLAGVPAFPGLGTDQFIVPTGAIGRLIAPLSCERVDLILSSMTTVTVAGEFALDADGALEIAVYDPEGQPVEAESSEFNVLTFRINGNPGRYSIEACNQREEFQYLTVLTE